MMASTNIAPARRDVLVEDPSDDPHPPPPPSPFQSDMLDPELTQLYRAEIFISADTASERKIKPAVARTINLLCSIAKLMFTQRDPCFDYEAMRILVTEWNRRQRQPPDGANVPPIPGSCLRYGFVQPEWQKDLSYHVQAMVGFGRCVQEKHLSDLVGLVSVSPLFRNHKIDMMDALLIFFRYMLWSVNVYTDFKVEENSLVIDNWIMNFRNLGEAVIPPDLDMMPKNELLDAFFAVGMFRHTTGMDNTGSKYGYCNIPSIPKLIRAMDSMTPGGKDRFEYMGGTIILLLVHLAFIPHTQLYLPKTIRRNKADCTAWRWLYSQIEVVDGMSRYERVVWGPSEYHSLVHKEYEIDRKLFDTIVAQDSLLARFRVRNWFHSTKYESYHSIEYESVHSTGDESD